MRLTEGLEGIAAALAVIALGVVAFTFVMRRRPTPQGLGFAALTEIPQRAQTIAERLFPESPHSVFHKSAADWDFYLMFVEARGSETPDCVVGLAEIRTSREAADIAVLHSERRIPKVLRRLNGGIFTWAQPVNPVTDSLRPGAGWFWYAAEDGLVEDTPVTRAMAQTSRDHGSRKLLGLASLDSHLVVWASLSHIDAVVSRLERLAREQRDVEEHD